MKITNRDGIYEVTPETKFDLIILYWLIKKTGGIGATLKWQEKIESGLKTKRTTEIVRIYLEVDDIRFEEDLRSIRVTGNVVKANKDELIGRRLGLDISIQDYVILGENKFMEILEKKITQKTPLLVIIIDIDGYIIAEVKEQIEIIMEKYLSTSEILEEEEALFKKDLAELQSVIETYRKRGLKIILGFNVGTRNIAKKIKNIDVKLEGPFSANINGVINLLSTLAKEKEIQIENEFLESLKIYNDLFSKDMNKIVYGLNDIVEKLNYRVIHTLIFTEKIVKDENTMEILSDAYFSCIKLQLTDSRSSLGRYVNQYGGIVGITY